MALRSVQTEWEGFAAMVIPKMKPGETQYDEMQKAFFAGAFSLLTANQEIGEPHISESEAMEYLTAIDAELKAFYRGIMKDYAERN